MIHHSPENLDPRIQRTRLLLQEALGKLLETKGFEEISVGDVADAAGVNRATFYDHYADKFGLLECMVGNRFCGLLSERKVQFDSSCASAMRSIVLAVCDYVAQILGPERNRPLAPHMESAIIAVVRRRLMEGLAMHPSKKNIPPEMIAATVSWAVYGAAKEWAQAPNRLESDKIVDTVVALVSPILEFAHEESTPEKERPAKATQRNSVMRKPAKR
jgi:AcrR family transcriptional regulator